MIIFHMIIKLFTEGLVSLRLDTLMLSLYILIEKCTTFSLKSVPLILVK